MKSRRPMGFWNRPANELARVYPAEDANSAAGYIRISRNNTVVYLHRWLWEQLVGEIPAGHTIDHINGVRTDNRLANLRAVPRNTNLRNARQSCRNRSGVTGVSFWATGNAWRAITHDPATGKQVIRTFSVAKYGTEEAFRLACAEREKALRLLVEAGTYTARHGQKAVLELAEKEIVE